MEGFRIEVSGFSVMEPMKSVKECRAVNRRHFQGMLYLLREYPTDIFFGVFHLPDRVCHVALNHTGLPVDPDKDELSALVASYFRDLDYCIGALAEEYAADGSLFMLVSDHGFSACRRALLLNSWLAEKGYLKLKPLRGLRKLGINQRRVASVLDKVGLLKAAMRVVPEGMRRKVPQGSDGGARLSIVDFIQADGIEWESTLAVALPNHVIYLNTLDRPRGVVAPGRERDSLMEQIKRELLEVKDPVSGDGVISHVHSREDLYRGPRISRAPALIVETVEGWTTHASVCSQGSVFTDVQRADHRREGIF